MEARRRSSSLSLGLLSLALEPFHTRPEGWLRNDAMTMWDKELGSAYELNDEI